MGDRVPGTGELREQIAAAGERTEEAFGDLKSVVASGRPDEITARWAIFAERLIGYHKLVSGSDAQQSKARNNSNIEASAVELGRARRILQAGTSMDFSRAPHLSAYFNSGQDGDLPGGAFTRLTTIVDAMAWANKHHSAQSSVA